ncbi:KHG/KDPG aldolase [Leucobacter sp. BZR 635]
MMNAELSNTYFDEAFASNRAMGILRGYDAEQTLALATRAWDAGISLIEVPLQNEESELAMRACIAEAANRGVQAGAGTIISTELVERAAAAGAAFTVAPGLDLAVAARSIELGMPHLAGVGSATEVQQASLAGLRWLKAFPARELGASWITAMRGPFPDVRFVATGGIDGDNAETFLDAGAGAVSLGGVFAQLSDEQLQGMRRP